MAKKTAEVGCKPIKLLGVSGTFSDTVLSAATVTLEIEGERVIGQASGQGPIEAIFKVIQEKAPHTAKLKKFEIVGKGDSADMPGEAVVTLTFEGGGDFTGRDSNKNSVTAAAQAYLAALNELRNFQVKRSARFGAQMIAGLTAPPAQAQ